MTTATARSATQALGKSRPVAASTSGIATPSASASRRRSAAPPRSPNAGDTYARPPSQSAAAIPETVGLNARAAPDGFACKSRDGMLLGREELPIAARERRRVAHEQRYDPLASTESVRLPIAIDLTRCSQKAITRTATGAMRASSARARCETETVSRIQAG